MSDEKVIENAKAEREFLHDISTPIMIASGHLEYLNEHGVEKDLEKSQYRIEKAYASMKKLISKLEDRRKVLHEISGAKK